MCMAKTVEIEADVPIASDGEYAESDSVFGFPTCHRTLGSNMT